MRNRPLLHAAASLELVASVWLAAALTFAPTRPAVAQVAAAFARTTTPDTSWVARSALYEVNVRDFSPTGDLRGALSGLH